MKCPRCDAKIDEFTEICPNCNLNIDEYEENDKEEIEYYESKTKLLKVINVTQLIGFIIYAIINLSNNALLSFVYVIIGLVVFAFIKGFSNIIDLLDDINNKLD